MANKIFNQKVFIVIAIIFAVIGGFLVITSPLIPAFVQGQWFNITQIDASAASNYGGFIGGVAGSIFALVSAILLFVNFKAQETSFSKQQVENKIFELIRFHRDNISEMKQLGTRSKEYIEGREVFLLIYEKFLIYYEHFSSSLKEMLEEGEIINISYLFLFFGSDVKGKESLLNYLSKLSLSADIEQKIRTARIIFERNDLGKYSSEIKEHHGFQSKLGHYFRHLYHTVKYINQNTILDDEEKITYIKMLRAQFSTAEQMIIFLNSLSTLGRAWQGKTKDSKEDLITKYALIKNLSPEYFALMNPSQFYPEIQFEWQDE